MHSGVTVAAALPSYRTFACRIKANREKAAGMAGPQQHP